MAQKNVPETPLPTPGDTEETDTPSGPENTATATPDTSAAQPVQTYEVPSTYTIQKGEFPFCIARRFDINQYDLLAYNNLGLNTRLDPGATIQIPPNPRPFSGNRSLMKHPTTYTVQAGDTFHSIACKFGDVDPRAIADANNMDINQSLTAGSTISIP
jgi:LysM repeat protein